MDASQMRLFSECRPAAPAGEAPLLLPPAAAPVQPQSAAPLHVCVLGSGSGGNSTVVRHGQHAFLIDAGFGPRTTDQRLRQVGLCVGAISAICLTHLDQDHFRPTWFGILLQHRIRVYLHHWHLRYMNQYEEAADLRRADLLRAFDGEAFEPAPGVTATTVRLPHDEKGTSAFHLSAASGRIGYATDLGHVPQELIAAFAGVDLLLLESNYDPRMQTTSSRPQFLKDRIMGDHGHLSNGQAFEAARAIADRSPQGNPQRIVLLHRSRQCNTAELVRRTFAQDARFRGRVIVAEQRRRTALFEVKPLVAVRREQMGLWRAGG
jgi:phosphoribosyl 1,2-cyclic phosphodiesterase